LCVLLKSRLCQAKKALVKTCHNILSTCCVQPILENSGQEEGLNVYIEDYLQILSAFLSEKHFLVYYNDLFPIEDDIHIVTQISTNIDETRIWFILDAISNAGLMFGKKTLEEKKPCQDKTVTDQQIKALPEEFESTPYCEL
ncbi:activating signal cointegrator 1 complex subunit 2-like, partial [Saccoglossus kowalevskii]